MRTRLLLALSLVVGVMAAGCGLPLGDGTQGSPCSAFSFKIPGSGDGLSGDYLDFMSCAEDFQCDTSVSLLDVICYIDLSQQMQVIADQLIAAFGLPPGLATITAGAAELWDPVCDLLVGRINSDWIGTCADPEAYSSI